MTPEHRAIWNAGAEAMREACLKVAQETRVPFVMVDPQKYAIGIEIGAVIRALPLPEPPHG